jgi:hypothetical protein
VRTAAVTLNVKDLPTAVRSVRTITSGLGGYVSHEQTGFGGARPVPTAAASGAPTTDRDSVLELRIPVQRLDEAMTAVEALGLPTVRSSSAQDVTGDVADLDSRAANQQASVDRIRALMQSATSIKDIVLLESELAQREGDLKALQARLSTLKDQAQLATYTVDLTIPTSVVPSRPTTGFLVGLSAGWQALSVTTIVLVTALGALLPTAVAVAALGTGIWWLLRHRRREAHPASTTSAP